MPKAPLTHHLVALWFADIAGYSERAAEDEPGALQLIEILQALSRDAVLRYKGRIVKFMGDAVLAEFPSTKLAVCAAAELSEQYPEQSVGTGHAHNLRIGVHIADVAVGADGDLYGDGVNATARVQQAAEPGQVVVTQDVWRQLRGRAEFQFQSLGDRSLKGVGSIGLYGVTLKEPPMRLPSASAGSEIAEPAEEKKAGIRSIAVLPFADLSPERDQEYFSDGIAEEILNALTKVGDLHVPARTSCFAFRGASMDARQIGKRLGVDTLLDGSIRKAGKQLRISVQLIDARNGYQLWSERFDRELEDIFAIQDEIAHNVLSALGLSLTQREQRRLLKPSTTNVRAYEFYLRGRKFFQKWTRQSIEFARQMFEQAIELDQNFAAAWAGLATAHLHLVGWRRGESDFEGARKASARALELDPELAEAHVAAAQGFSMEQRYADATAAFERAIELDPTLFDAYYYYARSCFKAGDLEKSLRLFRQARCVRPEDYQPSALIALVLTQLGRHDEARRTDELALDAINKSLELNPDDARAYSLGAGILARLGEIERTKRWDERAMSLAPDDDAILYNVASHLAHFGEKEKALDALERAIEAGLAGGDWVRHDPDWQRLRGHPRFEAILNRIAPS
ncbi:MAG TPA: tetratricopeptide repeat protein [Candidatus Udaeobacter sp.]|nr:tetratricopeptide repeat protein [Candidatus Udaeobacter sp.]